ncbi:MAG: hypothetical protein WBV94_06155 [Blastocatellia bacterium]
MYDFPLTPFLLSLSADGIRVKLDDYDRIILVLQTGGKWSISRLRGVLLALLVQSEREEELFLRRFNRFFSDELALESAAPLDIESVLRDIRKAFQQDGGSTAERTDSGEKRPADKKLEGKSYEPKQPKVRESLKAFFSFWRIVILVLVVALIAASYLLLPKNHNQPQVSDDNSIADAREVGQVEEAKQDAQQSIEVSPGSFQPLPLEREWRDTAELVGLLALPMAMMLMLIRWGNRLERSKPPRFDPAKPRHFPLGSIGESPAPRLLWDTLNYLADTLSYFQSEILSKRLNIRASISKTCDNGGLPTPIFHRQKQLRTVFVLEDAYAEPLAWNPVAQELYVGLRLRGINVMRGKFYGSPSNFHLDDGTTVMLEDLENNRSNYLMLFFSDGKKLQQGRDAFVLEALSRWQTVAWMDLREPEFWDDSAALIARYKIPIYPASSDGLTRAMERFLTEQGSENDNSQEARKWRGTLENVQPYLDDYVEQLLGDALPWAQACAMLQPVTVGLADELRLRFCAHIPQSRIERLFMLPGTTESVSGIRFSVPVLSVLRTGFAVRWSEEEQRLILEFIIAAIKKAEPPEEERDSLKHLAWEWALERARLELEPDQALKRIAQLAASPLGGAIKKEMAQLAKPDADIHQSDPASPTMVPLRVMPKSGEGQKQLASLALQLKDNRSWIAKLRAWSEERKKEEPETLKELWQKIKKDSDEASVRAALAVEKFYIRIKEFFKIGKAETTPSAEAGQSQITIQPPRLEFKNLKLNRLYPQTLTVKSAGGSLTGHFKTSAEWLRIDSALLDSLQLERRVKVSVNTSNLQHGEHAGEVIFISGADEKRIPVRVFVTKSVRERINAWWAENKPSITIQVTIAALSLIVVGVVSYSILPPNWLNNRINKPPELDQIEAKNEFDDVVYLTAYAKDPDAKDPERPAMTYIWKAPLTFDTVSGTATDDTISFDAASVVSADSEKTIDVKLDLKDGRGGRASYSIPITLKSARNIGELPISTRDVIEPIKKTTGQNATLIARVNVDSKYAAQTILTVAELKSGKSKNYVIKDNVDSPIPVAPGNYKVTFRKDLYPSQQQTVSVAENSRAKATATFAVEVIRIDFYIKPANSGMFFTQLIIDGKPAVDSANSDSFSYGIAVGTHTFTVKRAGCKDWHLVIPIRRLSMAQQEPAQRVDVALDCSLASDIFANAYPPGFEQIVNLFNQMRLDEAQNAIKSALDNYPKNALLLAIDAKISQKLSAIVKTGGKPEEFAKLFSPAKVQKKVDASLPSNFGSSDTRLSVAVEVELNPSGSVISAKALAGLDAFLRLAEQAALKWSFTPAYVDGKPSDSTQIIFVEFVPPRSAGRS